MAIQVIGAGFGRTGTESMKLALEMLGLGPCHHMTEVLGNPEQSAVWRSIAAGGEADWEQAFAGYRSAVDWPSAYFWRELSAHYPDAKILLTVRSAESWYRSMRNTICKYLSLSENPEPVAVRVVAEGVFGGRLDDADHAKALFEQNTAEVQASFGPDRLLTYRLGDGWEPLCRFLDKPIPDTPFPHHNATADFQKLIAKMQGEKP